MSKHHPCRVTLDGYTFDSRNEAARYQQLKLLERAGEIDSLVVHPRYRCCVQGIDVCEYVGDFYYRLVTPSPTPQQPGDEWVLEAVKSKATMTAAYRLTKNLMWACHRMMIREV